MNDSPDNLLRPLRDAGVRYGWSVALLLAGLLGTASLTQHERAAAQAEAKQEFDTSCREIQAKIAVRLTSHSHILRGGAAFFVDTDGVTRSEFRDFAARQNLNQTLPGIQGLGFALLVAPAELAHHLQEIRAEGFPSYRVWPEGERETYTSIVFLEPFTGRNVRAFGYDMFSEPVRRAAMERARDRDEVALSGKVALVLEDGRDPQAGTLMFAPVYRRDAPRATVGERRAALVGWVYSPYRMRDLISAGMLAPWDLTVQQNIRLEIFDDGTATSAALLYDSQSPAVTAMARTVTPSSEAVVEHAGHRWLLRFTKTTGLVANYDKAWLAASGGLLTSVLLAGLALSLANTRLAARVIATRLNQELRQSEERWQFAVEGTGDGVWDWNVSAKEVMFSRRWKEMLGFAESEIGSGLEEWSKRVHPEDLPRAKAEVQAHLDGRTATYANEHRVLCKDGTWKWILDRGLVVSRDAAGAPLRMIGTHSDITERKQVENRARESYDLLANLAQLVPGVVYQYRLFPDGRSAFPYSSPGMNDIYEVTPAEVREDATPVFGRLHPDDYGRVGDLIQESARTLRTFYCEFRVILPRQGLRWRWSQAQPERMEDGGTLWYGIISDITERKLAEEALRTTGESLSVSLREKEALLKEVHHRVKNNLQVITSLLRLEARRSGTPDPQGGLKGMQGRVRAMALLHESLYRAGTFAGVDLGSYVRQVATQSFRAQVVHTGLVQLSVEVISFQVEMDQAMPCGLLLNELVSNCLKHGFPGERSGEVRIELQRVEGGPQVRLRVSDTGVGLPADFEAKRTQSLGLELVSSLVRQIRGTLAIGPGPGADFSVTFTPAAGTVPPADQPKASP